MPTDAALDVERRVVDHRRSDPLSRIGGKVGELPLVDIVQRVRSRHVREVRLRVGAEAESELARRDEQVVRRVPRMHRIVKQSGAWDTIIAHSQAMTLWRPLAETVTSATLVRVCRQTPRRSSRSSKSSPST